MAAVQLPRMYKSLILCTYLLGHADIYLVDLCSHIKSWSSNSWYLKESIHLSIVWLIPIQPMLQQWWPHMGCSLKVTEEWFPVMLPIKPKGLPKAPAHSRCSINIFAWTYDFSGTKFFNLERYIIKCKYNNYYKHLLNQISRGVRIWLKNSNRSLSPELYFSILVPWDISREQYSEIASIGIIDKRLVNKPVGWSWGESGEGATHTQKETRL